MGHKIVAFKMNALKDGLQISALSESPRGTRVFVGSRKVVTEGKDKKERTLAVEEAVRELIAANQ